MVVLQLWRIGIQLLIIFPVKIVSCQNINYIGYICDIIFKKSVKPINFYKYLKS